MIETLSQELLRCVSALIQCQYPLVVILDWYNCDLHKLLLNWPLIISGITSYCKNIFSLWCYSFECVKKKSTLSAISNHIKKINIAKVLPGSCYRLFFQVYSGWDFAFQTISCLFACVHVITYLFYSEV